MAGRGRPALRGLRVAWVDPTRGSAHRVEYRRRNRINDRRCKRDGRSGATCSTTEAAGTRVVTGKAIALGSILGRARRQRRLVDAGPLLSCPLLPARTARCGRVLAESATTPRRKPQANPMWPRPCRAVLGPLPGISDKRTRTARWRGPAMPKSPSQTTDPRPKTALARPLPGRQTARKGRSHCLHSTSSRRRSSMANANWKRNTALASLVMVKAAYRLAPSAWVRGTNLVHRGFCQVSKTPDEMTRHDAVEWEKKVLLTEAGKYPVDLGLFVELEVP